MSDNAEQCGAKRGWGRCCQSFRLQLQGVQRIHQIVELILGLLRLVGLAFGNANGHADGVTAIGNQLAITLENGLFQRVLGVAAE